MVKKNAKSKSNTKIEGFNAYLNEETSFANTKQPMGENPWQN